MPYDPLRYVYQGPGKGAGIAQAIGGVGQIAGGIATGVEAGMKSKELRVSNEDVRAGFVDMLSNKLDPAALEAGGITDVEAEVPKAKRNEQDSVYQKRLQDWLAPKMKLQATKYHKTPGIVGSSMEALISGKYLDDETMKFVREFGATAYVDELLSKLGEGGEPKTAREVVGEAGRAGFTPAESKAT
ncbi:unnamed protein product, partial [marine sediment metagenome]